MGVGGGLMVAAALLAPDAVAHSGRAIPLPPENLSVWGAMVEFSKHGFKHILLGYDHLLFLAGLVVLAAGLREVVGVIGLFALAYSATLLGGTMIGLAVPGDLIDAVIAVSVGYVGMQIAFGSPGGRLSRDPRRPAFAFGLAHGLGLSSLLQELQLPGDEVLPSAIGFNVGVEVGQIAAIAVFLALLAAFRAFPFPARQRIPAGFAFASASAVLLAFIVFSPGVAVAHVLPPPPPPVAPAPKVKEIPSADRDRYRSYVVEIRPRVPGLKARIVGGQEKLEVLWTGRTPLVVEGVQGEPMARMSARGIELNERSPSAHLSTERYARVPLPAGTDPGAPPRWRLVATPGPISWFEHRAQWMTASRPHGVGDGARGMTIFHWTVPARLGGRRVEIRGALDWLPDPAAVRDRRSDAETPLLSAAILAAAMALGGAAGVLVRRRLEAEPGQQTSPPRP
jgi:hypothetical protein